MAKKKNGKDAPEEKTGVRKIEYLSLIESLSDKAFDFFVDSIIDDLNFKVLKRKDIRKIDIEEKILYRIEFLYYRSVRVKENGSVERYASFVQQYLESFLACAPGSRAEAYLTRAIGIAEKLAAQEGSADDLHDLALLFVGLLKSYKNAGEEEMADVDLSVGRGDVKLIRWISEGTELEPVSKGRLKVAVNPTKSMSDSDREFMFITTLLYSCIVMQENGEFEENV